MHVYLTSVFLVALKEMFLHDLGVIVEVNTRYF